MLWAYILKNCQNLTTAYPILLIISAIYFAPLLSCRSQNGEQDDELTIPRAAMNKMIKEILPNIRVANEVSITRSIVKELRHQKLWFRYDIIINHIIKHYFIFMKSRLFRFVLHIIKTTENRLGLGLPQTPKSEVAILL